MPDKIKTTIIPFLTVSDSTKAIEFYKTAFDAKEITRHEMPGNKFTIKLETAGAAFWVADEEPQFDKLAPGADSPSPMRIILTTADADQYYERAISAGAFAVCPMTTEEDWRIGILRDPSGHTWEVGYPLS